MRPRSVGLLACVPPAHAVPLSARGCVQILNGFCVLRVQAVSVQLTGATGEIGAQDVTDAIQAKSQHSFVPPPPQDVSLPPPSAQRKASCSSRRLFQSS